MTIYVRGALCNQGYGVSHTSTMGSSFTCTACPTTLGTTSTLVATTLAAPLYVSILVS